MDPRLDFLKVYNRSFMLAAAEKISTDKEFIQTLRRAARSCQEPTRYYGLQDFQPALGFLDIDFISADALLSLMQDSPNLLREFKEKVNQRDLSRYVKDDHSQILIPMQDRLQGSYEIMINITGYTHGQEGHFEPIEDPMTLDMPIGLERIADFRCKFL